MRASCFMFIAGLLLSFIAATANAASNLFRASSRPRRAALVGLYTSEGCNNCRPADNWLSQIDREHDAKNVVPLALYVGYWDDFARKDRFAQPALTERRQRLTSTGGRHVAYTPEVFVWGQELRDWSSASGFASRVETLNSEAPLADVHIDAHAASPGNIAFTVDMRARSPLPDDAVAYAAIYEDRLQSDVKGGENQGATLHHDRVVRRWIGPVKLVGGHAQIAADYATDARPRGAVAFVENGKIGEVLQVAELAACGD